MNKEFNVTEFYDKVGVLDNIGFVELIDGMASDPKVKIVNAARVSYNKEVDELSEKDIKLIGFLKEHGHFSTFRHSYYTFRIKAPLYVFRQFWKYQIGAEWMEDTGIGSIELPSTSWNETSGRFVEFEPEFYIPDKIRKQNTTGNKQGSSGEIAKLMGEDGMEHNASDVFKTQCENMFLTYEALVKEGYSSFRKD
jgi:thymidylate synthase (FAD)